MPPTRPEDDRPEPDEEAAARPPGDAGEDERTAAEREATEFGGE